MVSRRAKRARNLQKGSAKQNPPPTSRRQNAGRSTMVTQTRSAPLVRSTTVKMTGPRMSQVADGIRVVNSEKLVTLAAGTTLNRNTNPFNPNSSAFAWLSTLAKAYSKYTVNRLKYIYVPSVATTQGGILTSTWFGDAADADSWYGLSGNDAALACTYHAYTGPLWDCATILDLSKAQIHQTQPYFAVGGPASIDSTECAGSLALYWTATPAFATSTSPGAIYVEYDITFVQTVSPAYNLSKRFLGVPVGPRPPPDPPGPPGYIPVRPAVAEAGPSTSATELEGSPPEDPFSPSTPRGVGVPLRHNTSVEPDLERPGGAPISAAIWATMGPSERENWLLSWNSATTHRAS